MSLRMLEHSVKEYEKVDQYVTQLLKLTSQYLKQGAPLTSELIHQTSIILSIHNSAKQRCLHAMQVLVEESEIYAKAEANVAAICDEEKSSYVKVAAVRACRYFYPLGNGTFLNQTVWL